MEKAKVIKIWPSAHVEVRLHVSEQMEKDFKKCRECVEAFEKGKLKVGYVLKIANCEKCSWNNVKIFGRECCVEFDRDTERQLEEK